MLRGGDGWHYNVTGLSDGSGKLRALVTRRKLIQYPPDRGSAAHARLPACDSAEDEAVFLNAARVLLSTVRYHGLFGCEWLKERTSGEIFALDFNPRSVSGNSHLVAAGVNLAYLAYRDLCGEDLSAVPERAPVRLLYWATLGLRRRLVAAPGQRQAGLGSAVAGFAALPGPRGVELARSSPRYRPCRHAAWEPVAVEAKSISPLN